MMEWTLKYSKTNALADGLIERASSMLDEIASKTVHKDKEGDKLFPSHKLQDHVYK